MGNGVIENFNKTIENLLKKKKKRKRKKQRETKRLASLPRSSDVCSA